MTGPMTQRFAAGVLGVSEAHMANLRKRGLLQARKQDGRFVYDGKEVYALNERGWAGRQNRADADALRWMRIGLHEDTLDVVARVAKRARVSRSQLIRHAVELGLREAAKAYGAEETLDVANWRGWTPREELR